ncbi:MAG: hypothetical protein ACE5HS_11870 [bacterium]
MKYFNLILLILILVVGAVNGAPRSRHVLALYNSEQGQTPTANLIHENSEVILNHLGLTVDYWDIKHVLPDESTMQKYFGVIAWFHGNFTRDVNFYIRWMIAQLEADKKLLIFGDLLPANYSAVASARLDKLFKLLGFKVLGDWTNDITLIELVWEDVEMMEFERKLVYEMSSYLRVVSTHSANRVYLRLKRKDLADSESDIVLTTPAGGFAPTPYVYYQNPKNFKKAWRIDPFRFFDEALGIQNYPRPDVTTLNGQRIWCSHIDGDALISQSEIKPNTVCGEIIRDEILQKYPWPVSVSVVVAEVEKSPKFKQIARAIYRLPWIEAASHSYSHPFYWADDYKDAENYESRHLPVAGYQFNIKTEVVGSVNYINKNLLPENKNVRSFFWTGNCEPTAEAVKYCDLINVSNFNGGDTVFDDTYRSYTNVTPLSAQVGERRQIYSPNANENIYTNNWQGPFYGFKLVLDTFKNTESPIRIKPINVYYHFYSGEKWASLNALKEVMEKTMAQEVAPLFVSEYIDVVEGFYSTRIEQIAPEQWEVKDFGACTTIRFDNTQKYPDFKKSSGVLGFLHYQGSLYVHLNLQKSAKIVLTSRKPRVVYLERASHRVKKWRASSQKISFQTRGFGKGRFVLANLTKNKKYNLNIEEFTEGNKSRSKRLTVHSDSQGKLAFLHPMTGSVSVYLNRVREKVYSKSKK